MQPSRGAIPTLLPELIRAIALVSHPQTAALLRRLNKICYCTISIKDIQTAELHFRLTSASENPEDCLRWATLFNYPHIVSYLLTHRCFPISQSAKDETLLLACRKENSHLAALLARHGADPGVTTELMGRAARTHRNGVLVAIIAAGGDVNQGGCMCLKIAALTRDREMVSILLKAGARVPSKSGLHRILQAGNFDHDEIVEKVVTWF